MSETLFKWLALAKLNEDYNILRNVEFDNKIIFYSIIKIASL